MSEPLDVAIIGLAGLYPGARNAAAYWQNILNKVDAITDGGPEWTRQYYDPNPPPGTNDRIYTTKGGFLHDLIEFDPIEFGVLPSIAEGGDPDHLVVLKHARDALRDAGYHGAKSFDPERAGVIVGRGTYANCRITSALQRAVFIDQALDMIRTVRSDITDSEIRDLKQAMRKQLPVYNADMVGPLTPNVIAGMVANRLNLMGPNFVVDAACASTLIAVDLAARELQAGRSDLMVVGGTQVNTPPLLYIQFCQIAALSRDKIRPFQRGSSGILLGEGVGMMVLKRLADAERDGDKIYAVIKGTGTSSDGKAKGFLAPRLEGEVLAVQRAYDSCGIDPATLDLIEAHGTGTALGDRTEIEALSQIFSGRGKGPHIAIGSVKSMIGHSLPASASASMIKTALALHHKVLPPMICDEPDPDLHLEETPFYINNETRPWIHGKSHPRRAGVNAFGFGGINVHVILEEYQGPKRTQVPVMHAPTPSELVAFSAESAAELANLAEHALAHLRGPRPASVPEIAKAGSLLRSGGHRLAIVCNDVSDLVNKLEQAIEKLRRVEPAPFKTRSGIYYGRGAAPGKVCLLLPGEGAQYPNMLADVCLQFPQVREWFDFFEKVAVARGATSPASVIFPAPTALSEDQRRKLEEQLFSAEIGAESVSAAVLGLHALLQDIGIKPDAMLGHSTGENLAVLASQVFKPRTEEEMAESIRDLKSVFMEMEADGRIVNGTLLTIGALKPDARQELLGDPGEMLVAMDNCPNQLVLFGTPEAAARLRDKLAVTGAICAELPFGRAYHTAKFKPVADWYRSKAKTLDYGPGTVQLYSACSAGPFPSDPDAIRELAAAQWENPVRFTETIERLYSDGYRVFIEVGPSGNLTSFASDTLRDKDDVVAVASNSRRKSGVLQLHHMLAQVFAAGVGFDASALYKYREIEAIDLGGAARAAPKRLPPKLNTKVPVLTIPQDWTPLHRKPPEIRPEAEKVEVDKSEHPNVHKLEPKTAAKPEPAAPPPPQDPRLAFLHTHFSLMQDFLDSQARILTPFGAPPAATGTLPPIVSAPIVMPAAVPAGVSDAFPLLGEISEHTATRLVCERRFDENVDSFLNDHAIGAAPSAQQPLLRSMQVVPFTFSMEIVAEAAVKLLGTPYRVVGMQEIRGHRWLTLDMGTLSLRIVAERQPTQNGLEAVLVRIFVLGAGGPPAGLLVFDTTVLLSTALPHAADPIRWSSKPEFPIAVTADPDLYRKGMFHGPRLQGVKHLRRWAEDGIEADLEVLPTHDYFAFTARPHFQIDAALLDAVGQLAGYWLAEQHGWTLSCFPFRVGRYTQYGEPLPPGTRVLGRAHLRRTKAGLEAQFDMIAPDGRLFARLESWEDRVFDMPDRFVAVQQNPQHATLSHAMPAAQSSVALRLLPALPDGFLTAGFAIWMRVLAYMVLGPAERQQFYALPPTGTRREEWLLGRIAAKEALREWVKESLGRLLATADFEIVTEAQGRPFARSALLPDVTLPAISISHAQRAAAAVLTTAAGHSVGVDFQQVAGVDAQRLVSTGFQPAELAVLQTAPAQEHARLVIALWSAKEAAAKASGLGLGGSALDWRIGNVHRGAQPGDPMQVLHVEVHHGTQRYDVIVSVADSGALAVCEHGPSAPHAAQSYPARETASV